MAGRTTRTLQELSAEVATNPNSTAFVELATVYRERGDLPRAMKLCLRGLQRHPTHVEAHYELGRIYDAQGERELALDEWAVVRQLAPDHLPARCAIVRLYMEEGREAEAERELRDARKLAPESKAVAELWNSFKGIRGDGARSASALFDDLEFEQPGTLGALLVDTNGGVVAGRMPEGAAESEEALGRNMRGAREEAERVASYLGLGSWLGMVVETGESRLAIAPLGDGVVVVATRPVVPAGRAARVVQRASQVAKAYLKGSG